MPEKDKGAKVRLAGIKPGEGFDVSVAFYEEVAKALRENDNNVKKVSKEKGWLKNVVEAIRHREEQKRRAREERGLPDPHSSAKASDETTALSADTPDSEE